MNGKFSVDLFSPMTTEERYAMIFFNVSEKHGLGLGEIYFPDSKSDDVFIRFYDSSIKCNLDELIDVLQSTKKRLVASRALPEEREI
ncbi:MAG: hypothetical protein IPP74_15170 [Alphaproteobacteria bacterium]|nr:hypothetical protein [Alphaproteobacteria bacterium]